MPKLICTNKNGVSEEIRLAPMNSIGRHPGNRIHLPDPLVSNSHCLIYLRKKPDHSGEEEAVARDLGSRNGTYVNSRLLAGNQVLQHGDELLIGDTLLQYSTRESVTADKVVQVRSGDDTQTILAAETVLEPIHFPPEQDIRDEAALRADYEKLRVTYEIQRDIGLELDRDRILEKILVRTAEFLRYDQGVILLMDASGRLVPRAYRQAEGRGRVSVSSTMIRQIQAKKVGVISSDAMMDQRFQDAHSVILRGIRSTLGVPILYQDELLGILLVESYQQVDAYSEKDLHLLTNIANQAGYLLKNAQMAKKIETEAAARERFQRMLSPDLAELVVSGKLAVEKGGETRVATVLFADIRGFTALSEQMSADAVLALLNDYYEQVVACIFEQEGTVDKYVGDEVMAIWGAPVTHPDDPMRAVAAARGIQTAVKTFNQSRQGAGQPPVAVGIGINTGSLVAGYIGSSRTMSYSVIGDTVNTASRICSVAPKGQILISENTWLRVKDHFAVEEMPQVTVKGKKDPLRIFQVH